MSADALFTLARVTLRPARLREVSLTIQPGITAVLGQSGAGKTSLLNLLAGFEKPDAGVLRGDTRVAWAPLGDGLWPGCTAREHLTECGGKDPDALLAAFDLAHVADARPPKLSRGEQSRLALARALAMPGRTLVLDEPLAHVDSARAGKYWDVIRGHVARDGVSLVFATHSPDTALAVAQRTVCLHEGRAIYAGPVTELYERPGDESLANILGPANWLTPGESLTWLGAACDAARCVRPERLSIAPGGGGFTVVASRFAGAFAETELRHPRGVTRVFIHRPPTALRPGAAVTIGEVARG